VEELVYLENKADPVCLMNFCVIQVTVIVHDLKQYGISKE